MWGGFIPTDCSRFREQLTYIHAWLLERDSALRIGAFSYYQDSATSSAWGMSPETYTSLIINTTEAIREDHPDTFRRFFGKGDGHCISDYTYQVDGESFWEWIGFLVNNDDCLVDILE